MPGFFEARDNFKPTPKQDNFYIVVEDKNIVELWAVKWGFLHIEYTDGRKEVIEWEYDPAGDYKRGAGEYPMGKIEDACAYGVDYSEDEDDEED